MIKDNRNYHQRLQEFCDCFMETDYRKDLEAASKGVSGDPGDDPDELALKFLGLTLLYGVNEDAKKISLHRSREGKILFSVEARGNYQLPPPQRRTGGPGLLHRPLHHPHRKGSGEKLPFPWIKERSDGNGARIQAGGRGRKPFPDFSSIRVNPAEENHSPFSPGIAGLF